MSKIKTFDHETVTEMYEEVDKALLAVAKKFGIKLKRGKVKYSSAQASFVVVANILSKDGEVKTTEGEAWKVHCKFYGFEKEDFGREFRCNGKIFKIAGLMPRKFKYPILATNVNGRRFKFPAETVKNNLLPKEDTSEDDNDSDN
jgi:hypothetical protein